MEDEHKPVPLTHLMGVNDDLLKALKYARRFLTPDDHDVSYVDDVIDKAEGRGMYATNTVGASQMIDEKTAERVAAAIESANIGHSLKLVELVGGNATYRVEINGVTETFFDNDEADAIDQGYEFIRIVKQRLQAEAVIAALSGPSLHKHARVQEIVPSRRLEQLIGSGDPSSDEIHDMAVELLNWRLANPSSQTKLRGTQE